MEFVQTWIEFFINNNGGMIFGAIGVALAIIYLGLKENRGCFLSIHNFIFYRRNFARKKAGIHISILQLIPYICRTF